MHSNQTEEIRKELSLEKNLDIPIDSIIEQLKIFENGVPWIKLYKPCNIGNGVKVFNDFEKDEYIGRFQSAQDEGRVIKFVPASGAATRMFQKLLAVTANPDNSC